MAHRSRIVPGWLALLALSGGVAVVVAGWSLGAVAAGVIEVNQRNRAFQPAAIEVARGDTVSFVNDDGDLVHHVQSKSDGFAFDTGEQPGGARSDVRFTKPGSFTVLCGIHPRMRMTVTVK